MRLKSPSSVPNLQHALRHSDLCALQRLSTNHTELIDVGAPEDAATTPSSTPIYPTSWRSGLILLSLWLGTLLVAIDTTIIGTAIPRISTDFKALTQVGWYGSAYMLTLTAFQPIYGNVYKFFNAKLVYLASIVIFEGEHGINRVITRSRHVRSKHS